MPTQPTHTPGPWRTEVNEFGTLDVVVDTPEGTQEVATVYEHAPQGGTYVGNADLIVAACNAAMALNPTHPIAAMQALSRLVEACEAVLAVLAQAQGGTS